MREKRYEQVNMSAHTLGSYLQEHCLIQSRIRVECIAPASMPLLRCWEARVFAHQLLSENVIAGPYLDTHKSKAIAK